MNGPLIIYHILKSRECRCICQLKFAAMNQMMICDILPFIRQSRPLSESLMHYNIIRFRASLCSRVLQERPLSRLPLDVRDMQRPDRGRVPDLRVAIIVAKQ